MEDKNKALAITVWFNEAPEKTLEAKLDILKPSVTKIEGPFTENGTLVKKMVSNIAYIFKATEFSPANSLEKPINCIGFYVAVDGGKAEKLPTDKKQLFEEGKKVCYKYTPTKSSADIILYASCHKAEDEAKLETSTIALPFYADRWQIPGLAQGGQTIAPDLTYGIGVIPKGKNTQTAMEAIYGKEKIDKYKAEYAKNGFSLEKHGMFANIDDTENHTMNGPYVNPVVPPKPKPSFEDFNPLNIQNFPMDKEPKTYKAIYDIETIYKTQAPGFIFGDFWKTDSGEDVEEYKGDTDAEIFESFESDAKTYFAMGDLEGNISRMISKFKSNEGGIYEDKVLTESLKHDYATRQYRNDLEDYMAEKVKENKGDFSSIEDKTIDLKWDDRDKKKKLTTKLADGEYTRFARPVFNSFFSHNFQGTTIATNDIHGTEVVVESIKLEGDDYTIDYQITLWDHFGLDIKDMEKRFNSSPAKETFAAWFTLQHMRGYKPFITKATFKESFKGNIKEGKFERVAQRAADKRAEEKRLKEIEYRLRG